MDFLPYLLMRVLIYLMLKVVVKQFRLAHGKVVAKKLRLAHGKTVCKTLV